MLVILIKKLRFDEHVFCFCYFLAINMDAGEANRYREKLKFCYSPVERLAYS